MVMGFWNAGFGKTQNSHLIRHRKRKPCGSIFQNCPLLRSSWRANARCCWRVDSQALLSHFKTILKHLNTKIKENWKSSILLSVFRTAEKAIFTQMTAVIFWISKQFLAFQKFKSVHFEKYPKTVQIVQTIQLQLQGEMEIWCDISQAWHLQTMKQELYSILCLWLVENKCLTLLQCLAC